MESYGGFAKLYDALMQDVDYDGWADYLCAFLGQPPKSVVECACGTGEITWRLQKAGHKVIGVDISREMLAMASEKVRKRGMFIPFVRQDMRKLNIHKPVDALICACDGVNYLSTREAVGEFFEAAFQAIQSGGLILFDVSSRYKLANILGNNTFADDNGEQAYIWVNAYDPENKLCEMQISFYYKEDAVYTRFCETHVQRAHSKLELENALKKAGFTEIHAFDAFTYDPAREDSERIQFAARRP